MGTGPIENSDNNISIGKDYWAQQSEKEIGDTLWKGPDGSNNVPVGKTEAEVKQIKNQQSYDAKISWRDIPNVIKNLPKVIGKMFSDTKGVMHPEKKFFYYSTDDIVRDLIK